ncbi:MAG: DUF3619 family protein [Stagnimonas sp.]|nr:DUF3619 family protein [Stagnimonas sp.]
MKAPEDHDVIEPAIEPLIQALDQWEAELDPVQRARLTAARRRALARRAEPARGFGWLAPALTASVLLALGLSFWPGGGLPPAPVPAVDTLAVGEPAAADETLMDEDLEYLLWLASDDAA